METAMTQSTSHHQTPATAVVAVIEPAMADVSHEQLAERHQLFADIDHLEQRVATLTQLLSDATEVIKGEPSAEAVRRREALAAIEAMREVANWIDKDAPGFGGPNGQEAKLIGMEISGPTQCPSAYHCC